MIWLAKNDYATAINDRMGCCWHSISGVEGMEGSLPRCFGLGTIEQDASLIKRKRRTSAMGFLDLVSMGQLQEWLGCRFDLFQVPLQSRPFRSLRTCLYTSSIIQITCGACFS